MKTAVLGYGTVGAGVYEMLGKAEGLEQGPVLELPSKAVEPFMVSDIGRIINDPSVEAVAECMGGVEPAFSFAAAALEAGKHFVTSNKVLVAARGIELEAIAKRKGKAFLFSAACGGAIPFLSNMRTARQTDRILEVSGILNGTTNYILDRMQSEGLDFDEALRSAQKLGYAETDPTADISGMDAMRKVMLADAVAFGLLPSSGTDTEGIGSFTAQDCRILKEKGLVCRLIGKGGVKDGKPEAYVQPMLFTPDKTEAAVKLNFNLAGYTAEHAGRISLSGAGAGRYPTASAVLRDLSDAALGIRDMMSPGCERAEADNSGAVYRYFVRVSPGCSSLIAFTTSEAAGEFTAGFTGPVSVREMHQTAQEIRSKGGSIFFAAIDE